MADERHRELVQAVTSAAAQSGYDPGIMLALMGVESNLNPGAVGGAGGNYQGLIQFGPWERDHYGVSARSSIPDQVQAATRFLNDRGVRPGDDATRYYAAVLAGNADLVNAGDTNNGGRVANITSFVGGPIWREAYERGQGLLRAYGGGAAGTSAMGHAPAYQGGTPAPAQRQNALAPMPELQISTNALSPDAFQTPINAMNNPLRHFPRFPNA